MPSKKSNRGLNVDAAALRRARKTLGFTQEQLAKATDLSDRYLRSIECGHASPSGQVLNDIVSAFKQAGYVGELNDFLGDTSNSKILERAKRFLFGMYSHESGVVSLCRDFLDSDVVFHFAGEREQIPFAGTYCGVTEVGSVTSVL